RLRSRHHLTAPDDCGEDTNPLPNIRPVFNKLGFSGRGDNLGKITSRALVQAAQDADPKKDKQQHCEVNFYLGEYSLLHGEHEDATRYFRNSLATGVTAFPEY